MSAAIAWSAAALVVLGLGLMWNAAERPRFHMWGVRGFLLCVLGWVMLCVWLAWAITHV